ncbi:MAG: hypothetical protein JXA11_07615 [Phycisphaerae bacterium]|nr:hypothetical protein [Phycisphaerae bacterium]
MNRHAIFVFCVLWTCITAFANPADGIAFQTDFKNASGVYESAPLLPMETNPPKGPATVDFNDLKDPKFTPEFQRRNPVLKQVPGFSSCFVNRYGSMDVDFDPKAGLVRLHGDNPKVDGYIGKRFLENPPTHVEATIQRIYPREGGKAFLRVGDLITGAYVTLSWMKGSNAPGAWAVARGESDTWNGWEKLPSPENLDPAKPVKLGVGFVEDNELQTFVNDQAVGNRIRLENLNQLAEVRVGADARPRGVNILAVAAKREESKASRKPSIRELKATLKDEKNLKALNPYGTGIQIDYPFLGFSQAMKDPELFEELADILRELKVKLIRFPGGNSTSYYSIHGEESWGPLKELTNYWMLDPEKYKWADTRDLFRLCKAIGADCVFQLNVRTWYDPKEKKAYNTMVCDSGHKWPPPPKDVLLPLQGQVRPYVYHCDKLKEAAQDGKTLVQWAKDAGVNVIWEFGNENYGYHSPKVYVDACKIFYDVIREADPKAQFVIDGDGYSWSDWRWPFAVFEEMAKQKMDIAYTSQHEYIFGGSGVPFDNGKRAHDGIVAGWNNIIHLHDGVRSKLDSLGYKDTKTAMTEGNMAAAGPLVGSTHEHGMGRALGEAQIFPARARQHAMVIYHDLVHNGSCNPDGTGGWYARVYYHPDNPKGKRYSLPLDSKVMSIVNEHALRDVILDDQCVTASQWTDGVLLTAGNALSIPKKIRVRFEGEGLSADKVDVTYFSAENLDTHKFSTRQWTLAPKREKNDLILNLSLPPYSFCYLRLKAEK